MPVVPEKRQLEEHVHAAVGAQFWAQGVENSRYLSGQATTSPCEPQPLRLTAPSGLCRTQFLVATRAVRVPVFPGYCHEHGGTVVDRVLLQSGSQKWWAALLGRGKLQRAWNQHTALSIRDNLADPDNYALAATGRLQLSDSTVLRATVQSDSLSALQPLLPQQKLHWNWGSSNALHNHQQQQQQPRQRRWHRQPHSQQQSQHGSDASSPTAAAAAAGTSPPPSHQQQQQSRSRSSSSSRLVRLVQGNSLKLQLKQQLEGLDLTADLAMNEMCVDGVTRYAVTPLRLALDIAPNGHSTKRIKLQQSSGSGSSGGGGVGGAGGSSGGASGSSDAAAAAGGGGGSGSSWLQGVLFRVGVHGVVAPAGASGGGGGSSNTAAGGRAATVTSGGGGSSSNQHQQQQREHALSLHAQGALALTGSKTLWEAKDKPWQSAAADRRKQHRRQQQQQQQQQELVVQPLQVNDSSSSSGGSATATSGTQAANNTSSSRAGASGKQQQERREQQQGASSSSSRTRQSSGGRGSSGSSSKPKTLTFQGQEFKLPLLNPGSVQESIQEASSSLERLRTDLRSWRGRVEAGELQNIGQQAAGAGLLSFPPGSCWSSFIPGPHFKVSGLIGVLGRVPLHHQTLLLSTSSQDGPFSSSNSSWQPHNNQQQQHHSRSSSTASLPSAAGGGAGGSGQQPSDAAGTPTACAAAAASSSSRLRPEVGRPLGDRARGVLAASATHLDRLVLGSARKLGRSITQESLLRVFGSAGASLQVGEMRSNWFDFTRVEAVLDLGLNGPEALVQNPAGGGAAKSSGGGGVGRARNRAAAVAAGRGKGGGGGGNSSSKGIRAASPARGMSTILGPAAAAAHAAAAAQQQPLLSAAVGGSSDGSPRSSTIGSTASNAERGLPPTPPAAAAASAAGVGSSGGAATAPPGTATGAAGGTNASNSSTTAAAGRHKHPAFALEERGVWHSLTLSATQQLVGPVRLRADCRLALDSVNPCPRGTGLLQPSAPLQLLNHIVGVRPALVDAAYGVDMVVPGAGGLLRLVGWYSPGRGEGGLGLRLM